MKYYYKIEKEFGKLHGKTSQQYAQWRIRFINESWVSNES